MSSILKALKKLESDKPHRDELSTAVASDILRTSRRRKKHIVLPVAVCCVAVVLITAGYFLAAKTIPVQPERGAEKTASFPDKSPVDTRSQQMPVVKSLPPVQTAPVVENLPRLSGIIYQSSPEDRLAIINDLPVMEGTLVADFEVRSIYPDRVILQRGNSEFTLSLKE
jgi:general secretion pathway protein B